MRVHLIKRVDMLLLPHLSRLSAPRSPDCLPYPLTGRGNVLTRTCSIHADVYLKVARLATRTQLRQSSAQKGIRAPNAAHPDVRAKVLNHPARKVQTIGAFGFF